MQEPEWLSLLPPELAKTAYRAGTELAWAREPALRVLDLLNEKKYSVTGVDTWIPTTPGPTPLIDDWSPARAKKSGSFPQTARDFVSTFEHDAADKSGLAAVFSVSATKLKG